MSVRFLLLAVAGLLSWAIPAPAAPPPESLKVAGKEYVRLTDWAKSNGLRARALSKDMTELSSASVRFRFTADSRESRVNGVGLWLCFPAVLHHGTFYLSRLDLQTTVKPLLFPPKKNGGELKSICLDAGHGGNDPGNCVGPFQEKKFTLLLAQEVRQQLQRAGLRVSLTRSKDSTVDLPMRSELARKSNADLFVSLHFNSVPTSRTVVQGAEVYCLTPVGASSTNARGEGSNAGWCSGNRNNDDNIFLAYQIQKALTKNPSVNDRGVRRARFAVLRDAEMPAVLIEAAFMSHPEEGKKIFDAAYRKQLARRIVDGVLAYKQAVEQKG